MSSKTKVKLYYLGEIRFSSHMSILFHS